MSARHPRQRPRHRKPGRASYPHPRFLRAWSVAATVLGLWGGMLSADLPVSAEVPPAVGLVVPVAAPAARVAVEHVVVAREVTP